MHLMTQLTRLIVGCMTGTSLDGLDAALVSIQGTGMGIRATYVGMISAPLGALADELRHFAQGKAAEPVRFMRAARKLGELHADAIARLCAGHAVAKQLDGKYPLTLVVAHGQTIWHAPPARGSHGISDCGLSWQLMDPWPIVRAIGVPVVYDLRQADLIAGGQGAPITPASDWIMYRHPTRTRLIVNLGGICNVTVLRHGDTFLDTRGGDIGPCNLLLDGLVHRIDPKLPYDADGKLARKGIIVPAISEIARRESPFFSRPVPRTTGREDFDAAWLDRVVAGAIALRHPDGNTLSPEDVLASGVDAVARNIAEYARTRAPGAQVVLAGGGSRNGFLVERISRHCSFNPMSQVVLSDALGVPIAAREAMGFAVLGALSQDRVPITLPGVTGANGPGVAGAWAGVGPLLEKRL